MTKIHINHFMGMAPRYGDRKINPNQAIQALNVDLFSRELRPLQTSLGVDTPTKSGTILSIYPLNGTWLHWITDVDVVPAPLQTEQDGRIFYTGDKNPKSTNNTLSITGSGTDYPLTSYRLGLPSPDTAPTVGITGGSSGVPESRDYLYTFVTAWGEEGPPSSATTYLAAHDDATQWDISGMDLVPLNLGVITGAVVPASGIVNVTTSANHFLETGDYITIAAIVGMTDLNGIFQVTRLTATTFSVVLTTVQTYTSGGTWERDAYIQTAGLTKNLYRSVNGSYKLVGSGIDSATSTFVDGVTDAETTDLLASTYYTSPNGDLVGLVDLPNGALAGFYDNVLAFSEPYQPHAWPSSYEITFPYNIIAIEKKGNSVFVAANGANYIVTGYHPDSMSDRNVEFNQVCISKRSMVAVLNGIIFASPDGLAFVPASGSPYLVTKSWLKKNDWDEYNPASMHGYVFDDRYYGAYENAGVDSDENGVFIFDPEEQETTITVLDTHATAGYTDLEVDALYLMVGSSITQKDLGGSYNTYTWRSKKFTTARPVCFKSGKVKVTFGEGTTEAEQQAAIDAAVLSVENDIANGVICDTGAFGGSSPGAYTVAGGPFLAATLDITEAVITATLRLYADGALYATKLLSDSRPFRLPVLTQKLADTWEVEITGTDVVVHEATIGETLSELRDV